MKTLLITTVLASTLLLPASSEARARCGSVTTRTAPVTFHDSGITTYGGTSCQRARQVITALARRQVREFDACAVPLGQGGECDALGYACTVEQAGRGKAFRGSCKSLTADRLIEFNETQISRG